eukprot:6225341-Alexandrium_andersonii.AAC.1
MEDLYGAVAAKVEDGEFPADKPKPGQKNMQATFQQATKFRDRCMKVVQGLEAEADKLREAMADIEQKLEDAKRDEKQAEDL